LVTLGVDNDTHVLFGGSGLVESGTADYFADVYIARVMPTDGSVLWQPVAVEGSVPPARARHSAVALDARRMLIWGGMEHKQRFNDCWILDIKAGQWTAAEVSGSPPAPRAHHTTCKLGSKVFIFGGYGGSGTAFGDLWMLHLGPSLRWEELAAAGPCPQPRFDHAAALLPTAPNSPVPDKLVIVGGRDTTQSFEDTHVLDLESMTWQQSHAVPPLAGQVGAMAHSGCHQKRVPFSRTPAGCVFGLWARMAGLHAAHAAHACPLPFAHAADQPALHQRRERALPQGLRRLWQEGAAGVQ
jgi:hypothetical protein